MIEDIAYAKTTDYRRTVNSVSNQLIKPFAQQLSKSTSIVVELDSSLVGLPIEFLQVSGLSLAVFRPLLFTIRGVSQNSSPDTLTLRSGWIIRDSSCDPENACRLVARRFPHSYFRNAENVSADDLSFKPGIDFLLISAHGMIDSLTLRGSIAINNVEDVPPSFFSSQNPGLLYIDGCQQGINLSYITALAATPSRNYYIAPIVSNDSGESSTKTMNWFFTALTKNADPVLSIWQTRRKLHAFYHGKMKLIDVINKSFIFRIYRV